MGHIIAEDKRDDILLRLRKIEGQIRGIHKMVEREAECAEILVQVAAVKSAIKSVAALVIQNYLRGCVSSALEPTEEGAQSRNIDEWVAIVSRYME